MNLEWWKNVIPFLIKFVIEFENDTQEIRRREINKSRIECWIEFVIITYR